MSTPQLYGPTLSSNVLPCLWLCEAGGIKIEQKNVAMQEGEHKKVKKK